MKSKLLVLLLGLIQVVSLYAEEGMWIPALLDDLKIGEMQEMGLRLSKEDIYSINNHGITDAIVSLGGFCTAGLISDEGLIITNHHCGLRTIQRHSTMTNNYLEEGFWAMNRSEELMNPGLYVRFLRHVQDVSQQVLEGVEPDMPEGERSRIISINMGIIKADVRDTSDFQADIRPFYYGSEYYLFLYEDFNDVRLVAAPPQSIGKFGGSMDNWVWPRHTGDFSLLRIYANSENKPAPCSIDNVPYRPQKFLDISMKGIEKGDFTMVFGYPGTTSQYLTASELEWILDESLPRKVRARAIRIEAMEKYMNADKMTSLMYAAKYSSVSNYQKKWSGQIHQVERGGVIARKQAEEIAFAQWAEHEAGSRYHGILDSIGSITDRMQDLAMLKDYESEVIRSIEIISFASKFRSLIEAWPEKDAEPEYFKMILSSLHSEAEEFYRNYSPDIDREASGRLMEMYYRDIPAGYQPDMLIQAADRFRNNFMEYSSWLFDRSLLAGRDETMDHLENFNTQSWDKLGNDPFYLLALEFETIFNSIDPVWDMTNLQKTGLIRTHMEGLREWKKDRILYPDANRTMRISYGDVEDYRPRDALRYGYITTLDGVFEKNNRGIPDYDVPAKLKDLYDNMDYGIYNFNGTVPVCFITSNHTTNGNSGSPVLNGEGQLIGVNFDRNWEGTISDYTFIESQCRNISIDIRYALFIIDKFAGAGYLMEEMNIVQ